MKNNNIIDTIASPNLDLIKVKSGEKVRKGNKKVKDNRFFSIANAFKDQLLTEAMVSLGNSFELPVLFKRLG
jgi:hypothetical protein